MKVRAKFNAVAVEPSATDHPEHRSVAVTLMAVSNDGPDNEAWSKATPAGQITMTITNPGAFDAFERGKSYFVDFTPAD